mgnify:FL=1
MHESTQQPSPMQILDWFVFALVAGALILPFLFASADADHRHSIDRAATVVAALGCVLLLSWMSFADGAHSVLWRWLPPFWPWSRYLTSKISRWCLVVLLVLGTVLGIVFSR